MAVQFPDDLVVADLGTEERHVRVEDTRCVAAVDRIRVPVNASASRADRVLDHLDGVLAQGSELLTLEKRRLELEIARLERMRD